MIFTTLSTKLAVAHVIGKDAARIANNLCTANVVDLDEDQGCESFVTDVRGKTLGHVCIYRNDNGLTLLGSGASIGESDENQCAAVLSHFDRYTLREDSVPLDVSENFQAFVLDWEMALAFKGWLVNWQDLATPLRLGWARTEFAGGTVELYEVPWWPEGSVVALALPPATEALVSHLISLGGDEVGEEEFHRRLIVNRFPWYGVDIDATNLPQEADRDKFAISFTKGCYLGQETVARLDALGQVQKRLVRWDLTSESMPEINTELRDGARIVGRLTSIASGAEENAYVALGFARRSHFDVGSTATGTNRDGSVVSAVVSAN